MEMAMGWYKKAQAKKPVVTLCANCLKVLSDPQNITGGKESLTKEENAAIINSKQRDIIWSHGICLECCIELYGEENCVGLAE